MQREFSRERLYRFVWLMIAIVSLLSGYFSYYYYKESGEIIRKAWDSYMGSDEMGKRIHELCLERARKIEDVIIRDNTLTRCYDDYIKFKQPYYEMALSNMTLGDNLRRKSLIYLIIALGCPTSYLIGFLAYKYLFPYKKII